MSTVTATPQKRNAAIDFWKFIFAVLILLFHGRNRGFINQDYLSFGYIGVEFFMIVSGWFLAKSVVRANKKFGNTDTLGSETVSFLRHKFSAIWLYLLVSVIIVLLTGWFFQSFSFLHFLSMVFQSVNEVLMLQMAGFPVYAATGTAWYLSAIFIAMAVYYPIMRRHFDTFSAVAAPIIGILGYGLIYSTGSDMSSPGQLMFGMFYQGLLRGFAGIALGVTAYRLSDAISGFTLTRFAAVLFSLISEAMLALLFVFGLLAESHSLAVSYTLILMTVPAVAFVLSGSDCIAPLLPGAVTRFLAQFSMVLYLNHYYWGKRIENFGIFPSNQLLVYIALAVVTSAWCMFVVWLFKAAWNGLGAKRLFLKDVKTDGNVQENAEKK